MPNSDPARAGRERAWKQGRQAKIRLKELLREINEGHSIGTQALGTL